MKKWVLIISCILPMIATANAKYNGNVDVFNLCVKEKDPLKRQHYCRMLDAYSKNNHETKPQIIA